MKVNDDADSDYGYDPAHELKAVLALPTSRRRRAPSGRRGREIELYGDLGYDQAHER